MIEEHQWDSLVRVVDGAEWTTWPVFTTQLDRSANWDALCACLEEEWKDTPAEEVMARCQAQNVPVFVVRDMNMILQSAHERARGFFAPSEPDGVMLPTNPWMVDGVPVSSRGRAPALGEHTAAAFQILGLGADDLAAFHEVGVI